MSTTMSGKRRVRLDKDYRPGQSMVAVNAARDEAYKNAPRDENGRMIPGFRYKEVLSAYEEAGLEANVMGGETSITTRPPLFVAQPRKGKQLVKLIREGYPYTTVCRAIGISRPTFMTWMAKGRDGIDPYRALFVKVCKAEAKAEMNDLKHLREHQKSEWKVSAWLLERRWPEHWARRDAFKAEVQSTIEITLKGKEKLAREVVNDEASRELARRMIDGDEFGYSVKPQDE